MNKANKGSYYKFVYKDKLHGLRVLVPNHTEAWLMIREACKLEGLKVPQLDEVIFDCTREEYLKEKRKL